MGAEDFVKEGYIPQEEGGGSEPELRNALEYAFNAEDHGQPSKSTRKDGALPAGWRNQRKPKGMIWPRPSKSVCWCARPCRKSCTP